VPPPAPPARKRGSTLGSSSSTEGPPAGRSRGDAVLAGRLGKPHGLEGFLGLYAEPENLTYFEPESTVYVDDRAFTVRALGQGKKGPLVAFHGVTDRSGAEQLRGNEVFVSRRRELGEGEYWPRDLVGLQVRPGGGEVIAVTHGAAQDRLTVDRDGVRFEVPFVTELVPIVDLEQGFIEIVEIEGLSSQ
jgi:16S rRNA processing protein RimM